MPRKRQQIDKLAVSTPESKEMAQQSQQVLPGDSPKKITKAIRREHDFAPISLGELQMKWGLGEGEIPPTIWTDASKGAPLQAATRLWISGSKSHKYDKHVLFRQKRNNIRKEKWPLSQLFDDVRKDATTQAVGITPDRYGCAQ